MGNYKKNNTHSKSSIVKIISVEVIQLQEQRKMFLECKDKPQVP